MPSIHDLFKEGTLDFYRAEDFCRRASSDEIRLVIKTLSGGNILSQPDEILFPVKDFVLLCRSELRAREVFAEVQ